MKVILNYIIQIIWIKKDEFANYGHKINDYINFLLAISTNKVINYIFTKENINTIVFKIFMIDTINKLNSQEKNNEIIHNG